MNLEQLEKLPASEWPNPEENKPRASFLLKTKKEFQKWIQQEEK